MKEQFLVHESLLFATVCSNLPKDEVNRRMTGRPCGTSGGWQFSDEEFSEGVPNPHPCTDNPKTHTHYLFNC